MVDVFFLVEADTTHRGVQKFYENFQQYFEIFVFEMKKPLIWELVRDTERFQFMSGATVEHVVINMTALDRIQDDIWWEHFTKTYLLPPTPVMSDITFRNFENYQWSAAEKEVKRRIRFLDKIISI